MGKIVIDVLSKRRVLEVSGFEVAGPVAYQHPQRDQPWFGFAVYYEGDKGKELAKLLQSLDLGHIHQFTDARGSALFVPCGDDMEAANVALQEEVEVEMEETNGN